MGLCCCGLRGLKRGTVRGDHFTDGAAKTVHYGSLFQDAANDPEYPGHRRNSKKRWSLYRQRAGPVVALAGDLHLVGSSLFTGLATVFFARLNHALAWQVGTFVLFS